MPARKSSHGTIFLIVSSGSPLALIASSLRSTSKKPFCPMTRSLHPPMTACGHRVRFARTWREGFFEVPLTRIHGTVFSSICSAAACSMVYYAFDLLHLDGLDTLAAPLIGKLALIKRQRSRGFSLRGVEHGATDGVILPARVLKRAAVLTPPRCASVAGFSFGRP